VRIPEHTWRSEFAVKPIWFSRRTVVHSMSAAAYLSSCPRSPVVRNIRVRGYCPEDEMTAARKDTARVPALLMFCISTACFFGTKFRATCFLRPKRARHFGCVAVTAGKTLRQNIENSTTWDRAVATACKIMRTGRSVISESHSFQERKFF
jgi:hypothetical protein